MCSNRRPFLATFAPVAAILLAACSGRVSSRADADAGAQAPSACTAADVNARWSAMDQAPILPPNHYANLNLLGASGSGITLEEAQSINCTGTLLPADATGGPSVVWGTASEVRMFYDEHSHVALQLLLQNGYAMPVTLSSRDGAHTYVLKLGSPITKDGAPFGIDWTSTMTALPAATELDDAARATFAPHAATDTGCFDATPANCLVIADDGAGHSYLGFRAANFYVVFDHGTTVPRYFFADAPRF